MVNSMVFGYTPYPNAAKEYLRFMMEQEQYVPWQEASVGTEAAWTALAWGFHYDDVAQDVVEADLVHYESIVLNSGAPKDAEGNIVELKGPPD